MSTTPTDRETGPGGACAMCLGAGEVYLNPTGDPATETAETCGLCQGTGDHPEPTEVPADDPQMSPSTAVPSPAVVDTWGQP